MRLTWVVSVNFLCLLSVISFGQTLTEITVTPCSIPKKERKVLHIQEVALKDTFLIQQIKILIQEQTQQDSLFKSGLGYISLYSHSVFPEQANEKNIWRTYYITPSYFTFRDESNDTAFPAYYCYVGGRLVFIYASLLDDLECFRYSTKSKKALKKKLEPFLIKPRKMVARDETGKVFIRDKKFRIDGFLNFHQGKYIYFYTDKPPKVFNDPY